jgi:hypothetical protein
MVEHSYRTRVRFLVSMETGEDQSFQPFVASKADPWPALLAELDALRDRYVTACEKAADAGHAADVADAVASTLVILSDLARVAHTRLELRALMQVATAGLLREELRARIGVSTEQVGG